MFIIKYISNLVDIKHKDLNSFKYVTEYLDEIINYSICKKDIKSFLLFLYLHDTLSILHLYDSKNDYTKWRNICTYNYAYQINIFNINDLRHYEYNLKDELDTKIMLFLSKNMNLGYNKYFLKEKVSWLVFKKNIIKLKIRAISKIFLLYYKVLHNRYKPGGSGYLDAKNHFETN